MKRPTKDIFIIGFALFSMFFGAGNVIFPPYLGLGCGKQWILGFICYYMADIGLALLTMFAVLRSGSAEKLTGHIGKTPATILLSIIVLCIGPMLAIPRTAASTFEMSIAPLIPSVSPILFSFLFFALILLLSIRESAVVDIVGKVLTPALLIGLLILIVKGVLDPVGSIPDHVLVENVPVTGIEAGYQTMDVLAAMIFGIIILKNAETKGYQTRKEQIHIMSGVALVSGTALLIVYLGLTYLGVTMSETYDLSVPRTQLVVTLVQKLMGNSGLILFAIVVALACVTTAVALVSCVAAYFSDLSGGKLSYIGLCIVTCLFSAVVSNMGLDQIVSIAAPILSTVYPPTLAIILLSFFSHRIHNDWVFRAAALGALLYSLLEVVASFGISMPFLKLFPLARFGFGWILPAAVFGLLGLLIGRGHSTDSKPAN